jgi:hypothetical protein
MSGIASLQGRRDLQGFAHTWTPGPVWLDCPRFKYPLLRGRGPSGFTETVERRYVLYSPILQDNVLVTSCKIESAEFTFDKSGETGEQLNWPSSVELQWNVWAAAPSLAGSAKGVIAESRLVKSCQLGPGI